MRWSQAIRMLELADFLQYEVQPVNVARMAEGFGAKFDMDYWFVDGEGTGASVPSLEPEMCGSRGCMMGWEAALHQESGLRLKEGLLEFQGKSYEDAAAKYWGITSVEATRLFIPGDYRDHRSSNATYHANRLRRFVAAKWTAGEALA